MPKGIVLAGGSGTRLFPTTKAVSKQLMPIFDKPMVYFPISTLMMAGIREILIITTPQDQDAFKRLLGDNIFHGAGFADILVEASERAEPDLVLNGDATVFGYYVNDPERYGIAEFDEEGQCLSIVEKPKEPKSNYAVVGLYFYPGDVISRAEMVTPSERGELEITTLNQMYLAEGRLKVEKLPMGFAWLDTGTFDSLYQASSYVETIEKRQGLQIACLEEIAYNNEWIDEEQILSAAADMGKSEYGKYLKALVNKEHRK